jgi:urease accessory protein
MKTRLKLTLLASAAAIAATPALAHTGAGGTSGMMAGLVHPLAGLDHLLAMLAVGIWSALALKGERRWLPPVIFMVAMLAGAGIALGGFALPAVETGIAVSVLVFGLMIASAGMGVGAGAGIGLVAVFALLHGHAHGNEAVGALGAYMVGFTLTTAGLHLAGLSLGFALRSTRLAAPLGATFAAAGAAMLAM